MARRTRKEAKMSRRQMLSRNQEAERKTGYMVGYLSPISTKKIDIIIFLFANFIGSKQ